MGFRVPPAQDDNLKKTRSNPGNGRRQKDLDMRNGVPAVTEHRYEENGKVDEIWTIIFSIVFKINRIAKDRETNMSIAIPYC